MQERVKKPKLPVKAHEKMRIAGKLVDARGAHRGAQPLHRRRRRHGAGRQPGAGGARPSRSATAYKSKLTRYERQKILTNTAEILAKRREEIAHLITAESGLCLKDSLYEVGRAYDVYLLAGQLAIRDDSEIYSCDITPHGKARKHLHLAHAGARLHLGHHAVQSSAQHDQPQDRAGDRHQQPRGAQADRADAADRAAAGRHALRGGAAAARCCRS